MSYEERFQVVMSLLPGEENSQGSIITAFQYLKGTYKKNRGTHHKELYGEDKGQQVKVARKCFISIE